MAKDKIVDEVVADVAVNDKKESLIYVSPNIPGGLLSQYTVFRGEIPFHVKGLIDKYPVMDKLLVPVKEYPKIMALLNDPNSAISQARKEFIIKFNNQ